MVAVVAGASGLVGSSLLKMLLADPRVERVISVSRRSVGANDKLHEVLVRDLSELMDRTADLRGDVYFCCLGTTIKTAGSQAAFRQVDQRAVLDFARIAKFHGARGFALVSATGADAKSRIFYNRVKGETEDELKAMGLTGLTIFRPSLLIGDRAERRAAEGAMIQVYRGLKGFLPESLRRRLGTDVDVLARALCREGTAPSAPLRIIEAAQIL